MAAPEVDLGGGAIVKRRDVGLVVLWHVLTLGIYNWFWYYKINRELRDFGASRRSEYLAETKPWLSVLAVTFGGLLIVPPFVSWWRCTKRVRAAQGVVAKEPPLSGWLVGGLCGAGFISGFAWLAIPPIVPDALNDVWQKAEDDGLGKGVAAPPSAEGAMQLSDLARED